MHSRKLAGRLVRIAAAPLALAGALSGLSTAPAAAARATASASAATCPPWAGGQPPSAGIGLSELRGITAVSECDIWAVGDADPTGDLTFKPVIEHWTGGSAWAVVHSPNPNPSGFASLTGISAISASDIWAAGWVNGAQGNDSLIEHWNGTGWTQAPSPHGFVVRGISAVSPHDVWAVGFAQGQNLATGILHWDGTSWTRVPSPSPGAGDDLLTAVSARSATDAWAVGTQRNSNDVDAPLIEHWDGTSWTQVPAPGGVGHIINGVSVAAANDAWAVGNSVDGATTFILHWDGASWTQVPSPSPSAGVPAHDSLSGVTAVSAGNAWAVGGTDATATDGSQQNLSQFNLLLHWDGTKWAKAFSTSVGINANKFAAAAVTPAGTLWAAGYFGNTAETSSMPLMPFAQPLWTIVPHVTGDTIADAQAALGAVTLRGDTVTTTSDCGTAANGQVLSTTPAAGALARARAEITLLECTT